MRSGGFDSLVTFTQPGPPVRDGRSRVDGPPVEVAANVPCEITPGVGSERFANAENAASAPAVFRVRKEPDLEQLDAGGNVVDQDGRVYDIKSVRDHPKNPRFELEITAVRKAG